MGEWLWSVTQLVFHPESHSLVISAEDTLIRRRSFLRNHPDPDSRMPSRRTPLPATTHPETKNSTVILEVNKCPTTEQPVTLQQKTLYFPAPELRLQQPLTLKQKLLSTSGILLFMWALYLAISLSRRAAILSMSTLSCLPSGLLVSCTWAAMEVQVYACSMLVAHRPYRRGWGQLQVYACFMLVAHRPYGRGWGQETLDYWATTQADTWLNMIVQEH